MILEWGEKILKRSKKIIVTFLLMIITFNISSSYLIKKNEKQANALVGEIALLFGVGVSTGAFSAFYNLITTNGYHMQISDAVTYFANTYYDKVTDRYIAKEGKVTRLEELQRWTLNKLSNGLNAELPNINDLVPSLAQDIKLPEALNLPDETQIYNIYNKPFGATATTNTHSVGYSNGKYVWSASGTNGLRTVRYMINNTSDYFYLEGLLSGGTEYPTFRLITRDNKVISAPKGLYTSVNMINNNNGTVTFQLFRDSTIYGSTTYALNNVYIPPDYTVSTEPDSYASDPTKPILDNNINFASQLGGYGSTPQAILNAMETNTALQESILNKLQELEYGKTYAPTIPKTDPITGLIDYDQDIPVSNDSDKLWTIGKTLISIKDWLLSLPGVISTALENFWENNLSIPLNGLWENVQAIPTLLTSFWDTAIDVPMESIDFSKLQLQNITTKFPFSIPFDFINLIKQLARTPVEPDLTIDIDTEYLQIHHTIDIQPINKYIVFFRWSCIVTFIFILITNTQRFIKW